MNGLDLVRLNLRQGFDSLYIMRVRHAIILLLYLRHLGSPTYIFNRSLSIILMLHNEATKNTHLSHAPFPLSPQKGI